MLLSPLLELGWLKPNISVRVLDIEELSEASYCPDCGTESELMSPYHGFGVSSAKVAVNCIDHQKCSERISMAMK